MKKFLIILAFAVSAFATKPVVLEICRPGFCYQQMYENVQKVEQLKDLSGNQFIRLTFFSGKILDVRDATVVGKKKRN